MQKQMALVLGVNRTTLYHLEHPERYPHRCPRESHLRGLWLLLREPRWRERLVGTEYEGLLERADRARLVL